MNKQTYLMELEKALKSAHVQDAEDILAEYEDHFERKLTDGYAEEEIAAKLAPPRELAEQFAGIGKPVRRDQGTQAMVMTGLVFTDLFVATFFILLYAWVAVLAALSIGSAALGVVLMAGIGLGGVIPSIPIACALIVGLACIALAVLAAVGTVYCLLYVNQLAGAYIFWHKTKTHPSSMDRIVPPPPLYPQIKGKLRRRMRTIALVSVALFAALFLIGFLAMAISAGAIEFWHAWGWFGYQG